MEIDGRCFRHSASAQCQTLRFLAWVRNFLDHHHSLDKLEEHETNDLDGVGSGYQNSRYGDCNPQIVPKNCKVVIESENRYLPGDAACWLDGSTR